MIWDRCTNTCTIYIDIDIDIDIDITNMLLRISSRNGHCIISPNYFRNELFSVALRKTRAIIRNHCAKKIPWSHKPALLNRRFGSCRVGGSMEALCQPDANLFPTLCQPFLQTPLQAPLSVGPSHPFRKAG